MADFIDLRTMTKGKNRLNTGLIACLEQLIECTPAGEKMRLASFTKAVKAIKNFDQEITSGAMAKGQIPGIGKGIADRIEEFLKTGTLVEIRPDPEKALEKELCTVTGIGPVRAQRLMADYAVKSVADLIARYKAGEIIVKPNALTPHITVGLDFYYDLLERFPRAEADALVELLDRHLAELRDRHSVEWPAVQTTVCGSYRRGLPTCGDLDVLLSTDGIPPADLLTQVVDGLTRVKFLVGNLTHEGGTKYMGVCKLPGVGSKGRRIDIRIIPRAALGAAQLYFTGSGEFNVAMRNVALKAGYTLNEYGLYRVAPGKAEKAEKVEKSELIPCTSEEDIFTHLRIVYLKPHERMF
jgi:DNA polymerase/3'-5' exonuclease PolX